MLGGDRNCKFFHATVKANRVKNSLRFLVDENGIEHSLNRDKGSIVATYFENMFQSSFPANMDSVLNGFHQRVSSEMNLELTSAVSEQEIYNAVFSIDAESAPGSDGFTAIFFQKNWNLVKDQVIAEILGLFNSGMLPKDWNHTHLCLIP